jgi:hypothetical protein
MTFNSKRLLYRSNRFRITVLVFLLKSIFELVTINSKRLVIRNDETTSNSKRLVLQNE